MFMTQRLSTWELALVSSRAYRRIFYDAPDERRSPTPISFHISDTSWYSYLYIIVRRLMCPRTMATTLRSQKVALRKAMRGLLANLPPDEIQAQCWRNFSDGICGRISNSPFYLSAPDNAHAPRSSGIPTEQEHQLFPEHACGRSRHFGCRVCHHRLRFADMSLFTGIARPHQFHTHTLGAECAGKNLYVPKTTDKEHGIMDLFRIFGEDDLRALPRGLWGIREPEPEYMGRQRPTGQ